MEQSSALPPARKGSEKAWDQKAVSETQGSGKGGMEAELQGEETAGSYSSEAKGAG